MKALLFLFCLSFGFRGAITIEKMPMTDLENYIVHCDHPLIVSFWATYCNPCIKEIPYLQSTADLYKDQGLELILVSLDRPDSYPGGIEAFAKKNGFTPRIIWLDEKNPRSFYSGIDSSWSGGLPASLFINNKTNYRRFFDRQLTERQVEPEIKKMMTP